MEVDEKHTTHRKEEIAMPLYMCRWPKGDVAFVMAENKPRALESDRLDEFGPAEEWMLTEVPDFFMMAFRLSDNGKLELEDIGQELEEYIFERAYPVLDRVITEHPGAEEGTEEFIKAVREAVILERQRRLVHEPPPRPTNGGSKSSDVN